MFFITKHWNAGVPISNQLPLPTTYLTKVNDIVSSSQPQIGQQPLLLLWIRQLQVSYSLNTCSHPSRISLCFSVKLFYFFFKIDVNNAFCNFICSIFIIIITINIYNLSWSKYICFNLFLCSIWTILLIIRGFRTTQFHV